LTHRKTVAIYGRLRSASLQRADIGRQIRDFRAVERQARHVRMRSEQQKRQLVLVEIRRLRDLAERRRLVDRVRLAAFDDMAIRAPALGDVFAVLGVGDGGLRDEGERGAYDQ